MLHEKVVTNKLKVGMKTLSNEEQSICLNVHYSFQTKSKESAPLFKESVTKRAITVSPNNCLNTASIIILSSCFNAQLWVCMQP